MPPPFHRVAGCSGIGGRIRSESLAGCRQNAQFCLSQGLKSGPGAGLAASLGIATGSFIHALAAGLGLAALIAATPLAFEIIRWIGVGYLLWLAINTLRKPLDGMKPTNVPSSGALQAWRTGIFVCLLNPKVALFIFSRSAYVMDPC